MMGLPYERKPIIFCSDLFTMSSAVKSQVEEVEYQ